jgi:S-(hydroxymethyl)glutathione dehydrogenase / alcohol dehydrogenase
VTSLKEGDHVVTLFSPQCGACEHCRSDRTNLCLAIREQQNKGYLPASTTRFARDGEPVRHFMGTSTFSEYTVMPEIAQAKVDPEAAFDRACLFACGLSTGLGAAINTARVEAGSTCVVFGAGMVGLGAVAGCRLQGAERIVAVDLSADNVDVMRQAVESAGIGWGLCTVAGVAGKGETLDIVPRLLIAGRRVADRASTASRAAPRCRSSWTSGSRPSSTWTRSSHTTCGSTRSTAASS